MVWIDMDGVIANLCLALIEKYNKEFCTDYKYEDMYHYDINKNFDGRKDAWDYMNEEGFYYKLKLFPYAKEFINGLRKSNIEYKYISWIKDSFFAYRDKRKWVEEQLEDDPDNIIFCAPHVRKSLIDKNDFIVDDRIETIKECKNNGCVNSFLIAQPYNDFNLSRLQSSFKMERFTLEQVLPVIKNTLC